MHTQSAVASQCPFEYVPNDPGPEISPEGAPIHEKMHTHRSSEGISEMREIRGFPGKNGA
jgi:hypothetical protein